MNSLFAHLIAAAGVANPFDTITLPSGGGSFLEQWRDVLLILGAALVMATSFFIWAFLTRKDRRRHAAAARGSRAVHRREKGHREADSPVSDSPRRVRRRRRRSPSEDFPRNPTLAEAGGLPPLRPEEPEPAGESTDNSPAAPTQPQTQ